MQRNTKCLDSRIRRYSYKAPGQTQHSSCSLSDLAYSPQAALPCLLCVASFPLFYRRIAGNGTAQSKSHQSCSERCKRRILHSSKVYILLFPEIHKSANPSLPPLPTHAHPANVSPRHNPPTPPHRYPALPPPPPTPAIFWRGWRRGRCRLWRLRRGQSIGRWTVDCP